jgi:hypothetical protein
MFSGSREKEPKYACLSEARASHWQRFCPLLHTSCTVGCLSNLIKWRCLCRVLCLVRSPVTTLDCILLKGKSLILVPWHGPEISSQACLGIAKILPLVPQPVTDLVPEVLPRDTQGWLRSYEPQDRTTSRELIGSFIAFYSSMPRDPV